MYTILLFFTFLIACLSIYCIVTKRNMIKTVLGVEILTASVNLNFIVVGARGGYVDALAQTFAILSIAIGACISFGFNC